MSLEQIDEKKKRLDSFEEHEQSHEWHLEPLLDKQAREIAQVTGLVQTSLSLRSAQTSQKSLDQHILAPFPPLCKRCRAINPLWLFEESPAVVPVVTHSSRYSFVRNCSLCEFLQSTVSSITVKRPDPHSTTDVFNISLVESLSATRSPSHQFRAFEISRDPLPAGDWAECHVFPQDAVVDGLRQLKSEFVDFEVIKEWMKSCSTHPSPCMLESVSYDNVIPGLRLIDCIQRKVFNVTVRYIEYVCLSYVWGMASDVHPIDDALPPTLPPTIEDAITVTQKLGFKHLWVDRYCIDQRNESGVARQVSMMDQIYESAELTIIAAAGADPFYGLPGVGSRRRRANTSATIWNIPLISTAYNPVRFVHESVWNTRAWTYQEAFFSCRRLVFTEQQAYFECNSMACDETYEQPLKFTPGAFERHPYYSIGDKVRPLAFPSRAEENPGDMFKHIVHYSERELTKPSDIIKGILGTLQSFERRYEIPHCWGTPSMSRLYGTTPQRALFVDGLCWYHTETQFSRRIGFPSWSWTGWRFREGSIRWDRCVTAEDGMHFKPSEGIELRIELSDGRCLFWKEAQTLLPSLELQTKLSSFIRLSGWTTTVKIVACADINPSSYRAEYYLNDGTYKSSEELFDSNPHLMKPCLHLTRGRLDYPLSCTALHLGGELRSCMNILLLVMEIAPGVRERIGILSDLEDEYWHQLYRSWETVRLG